MAMAHGLPIVSTPTHHALELLSDSHGLFVQYEDDGTALAEALNALLGSSTLRNSMVSSCICARIVVMPMNRDMLSDSRHSNPFYDCQTSCDCV